MENNVALTSRRTIVSRYPQFVILMLATIASSAPASADPVQITGTLRPWHKVTLDATGFSTSEQGELNPFLDVRMDVTFQHESGTPNYLVPGYFAADGNAAHTSSTEGDVWRAHFAPDRPGKWHWRVRFFEGTNVSIDKTATAKPVAGLDNISGSFEISAAAPNELGFHSDGRLQYVNQRYLRFASSNRPFLKFGTDSPETLLAYVDFDGTQSMRKDAPLKTWSPHFGDWHPGDPTWQSGKGKGLIGAINYLADSGCNVVSFLTYNTGGDGDNVWPHIARDERMRFDCSKLDQWGIVFDHAQRRGMALHIKLQETENDDHRHEQLRTPVNTPAAMDGGLLGPERKLYLRELIARYGYLLAIEWNIGEENTQTLEVQTAISDYIADLDPFDHPITLHTYPQDHDRVYDPLLGEPKSLVATSLQTEWKLVHEKTKLWIDKSAAAGHPWVVFNDEQNSHETGVPADPGFEHHDGVARVSTGETYDLHDIRRQTLWGNLMAGGAGVQYYFGYKQPQNDLLCEDLRSRDQSWRYGKIAINFFRENRIPVAEMNSHDELLQTNEKNAYCLAKPDALYLVYLPGSAPAELDLRNASGEYSVHWFNPREGAAIAAGSVTMISAGSLVSIGQPPKHEDKVSIDHLQEDWLAIVSRVDCVAVEAEDFESQTLDSIRKWKRIRSSDSEAHSGASGEVYVKALPDTRRTHNDPLVVGENFCNEPGKLAILNYRVTVPEAGRHYIWVRSYSTGSEDNGIHVGIDGQWPASGQRMQWCEGKNAWRWESRQRTEKVHCGVPHQIYLDIEKPGEHTISFSMREDGFEFDRWLMTKSRLP